MNHLDTLNQLKTETGFSPLGDATGNLTIGRGRLNEVAVHIAVVENKIASGSLGVKECDKLTSLFRIVATQKTPLLLYLDSAGARVSEGLPALGAFRHMVRAALEMTASGAPIVCLLGAFSRTTRNSPCRDRLFWRRAPVPRRLTTYFERLPRQQLVQMRVSNYL